MTTATRSQLLDLLRSNEHQLRADMQAFADRVRGILLRQAGHTGQLDPDRMTALAQEIATAVLFYFLAGDGTAYSVSAHHHVIPKSPFMRLLWSGVTAATKLAVEQQADLLRQHLPSDLQIKAQHATLNPFLAFELLIPETADVFRHYVPQDEYLRADHKTLQDRLLVLAAETRRKVGLLARELLTENKTPQQIADTLSDFLTARIQRRGKPYGTTALADISRLLSSETLFAYSRTAQMGALLNPLVESVTIRLSPSHREVDICDEIAAGSPYPVASAPIPGFHTHCLCEFVLNQTGDVRAVVERLRGQPELLRIKGALSPDFADLILRGGR